MINFKNLLNLSREAFWVSIGQLFIVAGNFFLLNKLTKLLNPSDYGFVTILMSIAALSNSLLIGGINQAIFRFFSISIEDDSINSYKKASVSLLIFALGLLSVLYFPFYIYFGYSSEWKYFVFSIFLYFYSIFFNFNNSIVTFFNAARKRFISAFLGSFEIWSKIFFVLFLIYLGIFKIEFLLISYFVSVVLVFFIGYFIVLSFFKSTNFKSTNHYNYKCEMFKFSLPYIYWGAFISLQQLSDRFSLSFFRGTEEVGYYSVLFQIGYTPVNILFSIFSSVLSPIIYSKAGNINEISKIGEVKKVLSLSVILGLVIIGILFMISFFINYSIFKISVGKEFWSYSYLMPWFILPAGFFALGEILGLFFSSLKLQKKLIPIKIGTAVFAIICNFMSAFFFGMFGVVFSINFFSFFYFFVMYWKYLKFKV